MLLIGGVPVDGRAAQDQEEQPTTLSGRPIDTTGTLIPTTKPTLQPTSGAPSVPDLPTPTGSNAGGTAPADSGTGTMQTSPTDGGDGSLPFGVPAPTPTVPGVDTTGANPPGVNIDTMTPRTTPMAAPTGPAPDTQTPSSGVGLTLPPDIMTAPAPPIQETFGDTPAAPTAPSLPAGWDQPTDGGGQGAPPIPPAPPAPALTGGNTTPTTPAPAAPDNSALIQQILAGLFQNIGMTDPSAAAGAANPDTGTVAPFTSANVTAIDPNNDLRDKMITPATDDLTEQSRQNMADAQNNLSSFDRSTAIGNAMQAFSPDQSMVAPVDPGKDVSGMLDTADQSTMAQLAKLSGTDRQALVDQLFSSYQGKLGPTTVQAGGAISTDPSARLKSLQDQVDSATSSLSGVDRVALAKQMFDTFQQSTDPAYQLMMRQATQKAAATGGLGSGGLRTDYGNLTNQRAQDLTTKQNQLIQQAISDSVNDALNKQSRLASLESQLSGEEASQRGEQRTDRQYATDVNTGNVNRGLAANESALGLAGSSADSDMSAMEQALAASRGVTGDLASRQQQYTTNQQTNRATALNQFNADRGFASDFANGKESDLTNALGGAEGVFTNTASQEAARRNELRTERDYESGQEENAFERQLAQYNAEQQAQSQRFGQGIQLLNTAGMGNPASTLANLGGQGGGDLTSLIQQLAQQMGRNGGSTQPGAAAGGSGGSTSNPIIDQILASLGNLGVQTTPAGG